MKVLVTGGRNYSDKRAIHEALSKVNPTMLIHGGASGADVLCGSWAASQGIPVVVVPANWQRYGKRAGHLRNGWMLDLDPDILVAFPGGRGTANMVEQATRRGVKIVAIQPAA